MNSDYCSNDKSLAETSSNCIDDYKCSIIINQASVSKCEAKLFCLITERLCYEIKRAQGLGELKYLINLANSFLLASASKETAIADIINSCAFICSKKDDCH